jgi:hypothetical protein
VARTGGKWFKHYAEASQGLSLRTLWDSKDYEAYGLFWMLLEMISKFEDMEERGKISVSPSILQRETGWNIQRLRRVLSKIHQTSALEVSWNLEGSLELFAPNWSKLQENRGGKPKANIEQNGGRRKKKEEREKNIKKSWAEKAGLIIAAQKARTPIDAVLPEDWAWISRTGVVSAIGRLPEDSYLRHNAAKILQEAHAAWMAKTEKQAFEQSLVAATDSFANLLDEVL